MSNVSIVGAYNTKFGTFVKKDKETGEVTDTKTHLRPHRRGGARRHRRRGPRGEGRRRRLGRLLRARALRQPGARRAVRAGDRPGGLRFKPMTRCEDACASGSVALYDAASTPSRRAVRSASLVVGVEKMNLLDTKGVTHALATCSYWPEEGRRAVTFPCLFAEYAKGYQAHYKISDDRARAHARHRRRALLPQRPREPARALRKDRPADRSEIMTARGDPRDSGQSKNMMIARPAAPARLLARHRRGRGRGRHAHRGRRRSAPRRSGSPASAIVNELPGALAAQHARAPGRQGRGPAKAFAEAGDHDRRRRHRGGARLLHDQPAADHRGARPVEGRPRGLRLPGRAASRRDDKVAASTSPAA